VKAIFEDAQIFFVSCGSRILPPAAGYRPGDSGYRQKNISFSFKAPAAKAVRGIDAGRKIACEFSYSMNFGIQLEIQISTIRFLHTAELSSRPSI
jgi:hypothetical protein